MGSKQKVAGEAKKTTPNILINWKMIWYDIVKHILQALKIWNSQLARGGDFILRGKNSSQESTFL